MSARDKIERQQETISLLERDGWKCTGFRTILHDVGIIATKGEIRMVIKIEPKPQK